MISLTCLLPVVALASSWPDVPLPEGTKTAFVDRHIIYNGLNMQAQTLRSQKTPQQFIAFYRQRWGRKIVVNRFASYQVVGHRQGDYFITIQLRALAGGSEGRIGIIDIGAVPKHPEMGKGLPQPMGSKVFNDIRYPDDPVPARTVALRNRLSPQQNDSYFREHMEADGWKPSGQERCGDERKCMSQYTRGKSRLLIVAMRGRDGHSQVIINIQRP